MTHTKSFFRSLLEPSHFLRNVCYELCFVRKFTNKMQKKKDLYFYFFIYIRLARVKSEKRSNKLIADPPYILFPSFFLF